MQCQSKQSVEEGTSAVKGSTGSQAILDIARVATVLLHVHLTASHYWVATVLQHVHLTASHYWALMLQLSSVARFSKLKEG